MNHGKLKTLVLTSESLRHCYFANTIATHTNLQGIVIQEKGNYYTKQKKESSLIQSHFKNIKFAEQATFPNDSFLSNKIIRVLPDEINSPKLIAKVEKMDIDLVCLFGTGILNTDWLRLFPNKIVNLHLGLSPFYKGSATLFWPVANNQLSCVGTTIHLAIEKVDSGSILKRIKPDWTEGMNYYEMTNHLIKKSINLFPKTLYDYQDGQLLPQDQDKTTGQIYKKKDFNENELTKMLAVLGDGLSSEQLKKIADSSICQCEYL